MRRLDNPYKSFVLKHLLAAKRMLILIFVFEVVLIGQEVLFKDTKNTEANIQQEAASDVLGEKSESGAVEDQKTASVSPIPTTKPIIKEAGGADKSSATSVSSANPTPNIEAKKESRYTDSGYLRVNPEPYMSEYVGKNVNVQKGTIKFRVTPDWGENQEYKHKTLVLANFNGEDYRNLFSVVGSQTDLSFDTFDKETTSGEDDVNVFLGNDYVGKTFEVKLRWDFTSDVPIKQIFVNGVMTVERNPVGVPTETNGKIYVGPVTDLEIIDGWEEE